MIETAHRVLAQHRIFYLGDSLNIGGTECQLAQVAIRLKRAGLQIEVGCITARGPLRKDLESWDIPIHEFSLPSGLSRPSGLLRMLKLARFLRNGQFDVVHTHDVWSNLLGVPAAFLAHVPVIVSSRRDLASWWWYNTTEKDHPEMGPGFIRSRRRKLQCGTRYARTGRRLRSTEDYGGQKRRGPGPVRKDCSRSEKSCSLKCPQGARWWRSLPI